jgi:hypothetical protein
MVLEFAASLVTSKDALAAPKFKTRVILVTRRDKSLMINDLV